MKAGAILDKYRSHTEKWLQELETFPTAMFDVHTPGQWSLAQVTDHICKTTRVCAGNAVLCSEGKGEKGHSGLGAAVFCSLGSFPPMRIHVKNIPKEREDIYLPLHITKEEACNELLAAMEYMQQCLPAVNTANKNIRIKHWAGGWFNAEQWYHCAEMHIKHHFRQLKRIKKQAIFA